MQSKMPCPRLELRWEKTGSDWRERSCKYQLVIPLKEHDIRAEDLVVHELPLLIGKTRCSGGNGAPPIDPDGKVWTPYRDGAHAQWDSLALGGHIPIVAVCGDVWSLIEKRPEVKS